MAQPQSETEIDVVANPSNTSVGAAQRVLCANCSANSRQPASNLEEALDFSL
jgi:uncharacterized protein YejL (UPF0352 family)